MKGYKKIVVHTNKLLPYSETFIKSHLDFLKDSSPLLIGSEKLSEGIDISYLDSYAIKEERYGKLLDVLHKLSIYSPTLLKLCQKTGVQLIHNHFGQNGYSSIWLAKKLKVPHITTFHGFDISIDDLNIKKIGFSHYLFRKNIKRLQQNGDLFIAVSEFIKGKLLQRGFEESKVITNYLGIDANYFKPEEAIKREKNVVCIARHVPYKGHRYLISAFQLINQYDPDICLKVVGAGPETENLRNFAQELDVNVEFTGRLTPEQIKDELNRAMVYCQPSIRLGNGHEEALALTIVEAQSMGVPAVVFDSGGMPEAIVDNQSGYVVEEKNTHSLAEKIISLFNNADLWEAFSLNARKQVLENHNIVKQTQKLEEIYERLIKGI